MGLQSRSAIVDQGEVIATVNDNVCRNLRDDGSPDLGLAAMSSAMLAQRRSQATESFLLSVRPDLPLPRVCRAARDGTQHQRDSTDQSEPGHSGGRVEASTPTLTRTAARPPRSQSGRVGTAGATGLTMSSKS